MLDLPVIVVSMSHHTLNLPILLLSTLYMLITFAANYIITFAGKTYLTFLISTRL